MRRSLRDLGRYLAIFLIGLLGLGCAALRTGPPALAAQGPGTVFRSVDAAAVDALTYAYLEALAAHDTRRVRGGAIHRVEGGFSYDEIFVARPLAPHLLQIALAERDVARFVIYYRSGQIAVDHARERFPQGERRNIRFVDPLHRPLYILHPSLTIRVYRSEQEGVVDVADLRHPGEGLLVAGD